MKRFNVSILAVVAVLAIGLTAFTKAESSAKRQAVLNCYRTLTTFSQPNCTPSVVSIAAGTDCLVAQSQLGKTINVLGARIPSFECDLTESFFCCAQLAVDETPCTGQKTFDFTDINNVAQVAKPAVIAAIYCKSTSN
ncbi:hypothetical protein [Chitinophaga caseinilytica]|uniref:hypothetical protein n=1 Tax=Chitinophaga caseinilytica TaxID=2267521 RepID=UPI003C2FFDE8